MSDGNGRDQTKCPSCGADGKLVSTGSASGRRTFQCPNGHGQWREKQDISACYGSMGGMKSSANMTDEQRSERAARAANTRWRRRRLSQ